MMKKLYWALLPIETTDIEIQASEGFTTQLFITLRSVYTDNTMLVPGIDWQ